MPGEGRPAFLEYATMHINYRDIILAIENHSVLLLAGLTPEERQIALQKRIYEVRGMRELARRLPYASALVRAFNAHLEALERQAAG